MCLKSIYISNTCFTGVCKVVEDFQLEIPGCYGSYSLYSEDKRDYNKGWRHLNGSVTSPRQHAWDYSSASQLSGHRYKGKMETYSGGGYVQELSRVYYKAVKQVNNLFDNRWIDRHTRAVFVEGTLYNPNSNLFTSLTVLMEAPPTGGLFPKTEVLTYRLFRYVGDSQLFDLACEVFFLAFVIYFTYREAKLIHHQKKKYFKVMWNWIEVTVIALGWVSVAYYFVCLGVRTMTLAQHSNNAAKFTNFQNINSWQQVLEYIIAFLCFAVLLKFLKLLSFNKRMYLMTLTVRQAGKELFNFLLLFALYYFACTALYYVLMNQEKEQFTTVLKSSTKLMSVLVGRFSVDEMVDTVGSDRRLDAAVFFFYMTVTNFVLINMLLAIIIESFKAARKLNAQMVNDFELVDFVVYSFKDCLGVRTLNETADTACSEEARQQTISNSERFHESEEIEPCEQLSCRVAQLSKSLEHMYDVQIAEELIINFVKSRKNLLGRLYSKNLRV